MDVLLLLVADACEADRLQRGPPAPHRRCVAVLRVRVGRHHEQQAVGDQHLSGAAARQPALRRRRQVAEEEGEDDRVEEAAGERGERGAEGRHVGGEGVARQLEGSGRLQLEEVTAQHALQTQHPV